MLPGALNQITVGTHWQKRHRPTLDLRTSIVVQHAASLLVTAMPAPTNNTRRAVCVCRAVSGAGCLDGALPVNPDDH